MLSTIHEKEIVLELTFAIKANRKDSLFEETIPFYVKKLNCLAAFILDIELNEIIKNAIFPKVFIQDLNLKEFRTIIEKDHSKQLYFCNAKIDGLNYYIFKLEDYGYFVLVKRLPISTDFCRSLIPVFQFYAKAIHNVTITEENNRIRKEIEQEIRFQDLLLKMASTYVNVNLNNIKSIINSSLAEMGTFFNVDRSYIFEYDNSLDYCSNIYEWCAPGTKSEIDNLQNIPTSEIPDWISKHKLGKAFVIDDVSLLPDGGEFCLKNILSAQGIKSLIALPLMNRNKLMGFVGFDAVRKIRIFTEKEKNLLQLFAELLVNIQLREEARDKLKYQEQKYKSLLESVEVGLIEVDNDYNIEFINEAHTKLFGYTLNEVRGKNALKTFIPTESQNNFIDIMSQLNAQQNINIELDSLTKEGALKNILASIGVRTDINGNKTGIIGAFLDNTEQKELEEKLIIAKKAAESSATEKEKFLANVSHEMRTPLNVINGNISELINYKYKARDRKTLLKQAIDASSFLLNLVDNVLDLAKIKAGKVILNERHFNLKELCENAHSILSFLAKKNNNQYDLIFDEDLNLNVYSDPTKISQVLVNILNNALKFTANGRVVFDVKCLKNTSQYVDVAFVIQDNGIGIEKKFLKDIFKEFSTETDQNNNKGTGLGMPISKNIIDILDGKVSIESEKNVGTTINIYLKLFKSRKPIKVKSNKDYSLLKNKNILIVEDNQMNALIAKRILERKKANISLAEDGFEAINVIKTKDYNFDLILMDIQMPKLDGIKTTQFIRKELRMDMPIVAITSNVFKSDLDFYLNNGINGILTKPFTESKLLEICSENIKAAFHQKTEPEEVKINTDYNLKYIRKFANGDDGLVKELLSSFQTLTEDALKKIDNAILKRDLKEIKAIFHKIKPSISDLMLYDLLHNIKEVEKYQDFESVNCQILNIRNALIKILDNIK